MVKSENNWEQNRCFLKKEKQQQQQMCVCVVNDTKSNENQLCLQTKIDKTKIRKKKDLARKLKTV